MRLLRVIGIALLVAGSIPPLAALYALTFVLAHHMYTIGISIDARACGLIAGFALIEILCLICGIRLLVRGRNRRAT